MLKHLQLKQDEQDYQQVDLGFQDLLEKVCLQIGLQPQGIVTRSLYNIKFSSGAQVELLLGVSRGRVLGTPMGVIPLHTHGKILILTFLLQWERAKF